MQPTETQVERSLAALITAGSEIDITSETERSDAHADELPDGLLERIAAMPAVRPERLSEARTLVHEGTYPDADLLAQKMVGRIVCDRLR